jgi:hypothetical protein
MGPVPAGGNGRLCLAVDPAGAAVGFWEGGRDEGVVLVDEPGALCAAELHTPAPDTAAEFYRGLYGGTGQVIRSSSRGVWVPFFGTGDPGAEETTRTVLAAGARPLGGGLFADPLGAVFGLSASASAATGPAGGSAGGSSADPSRDPVTGPAGSVAASATPPGK